MDNYPAHLAPEFDPSGAIRSPFIEWWPRVRHEFPTVPENVAEFWLHEHWGYSPYADLVSRNYSFRLTDWRSEYLRSIRSTWCDFDPSNVDCERHGKGLADLAKPPYKYPTAVYMLAHGDFPVPIIVLDNRDGHLPISVDEPWNNRPAGLVLVEGHRRFNLSLYLERVGRLQPTVRVWFMKLRTV